MQKIIVPTLCFHSIRKNLNGDSFAVTPKKFEEVVKFVAKKFDTWNFQDLENEIQKGSFKKSTKVLITLDDGYKDNYTYALPILRKYNVKAIFFLLPALLGKNNLWNPRSEVIIDHLNIREAKLIAKEGHTIGSHGITHQRMTKLSDKLITKELVHSKKILEKIFNNKIDSFAYPFGGTDSRVDKLSKKIYRYSFGVDKSPANWIESDFSEIKRHFIWPTNTTDQIEDLVMNFNTYDNNPNNIVIGS